eukprot:GHVN01106729.1.p1 GENE.GHVN01106729.1~~GHVN01106729.1.p1  ORF type:complete len:287 (+),score=41.82 GHVN01106729.1:755-1615(+)
MRGAVGGIVEGVTRMVVTDNDRVVGVISRFASPIIANFIQRVGENGALPEYATIDEIISLNRPSDRQRLGIGNDTSINTLDIQQHRLFIYFQCIQSQLNILNHNPRRVTIHNLPPVVIRVSKASIEPPRDSDDEDNNVNVLIKLRGDMLDLLQHPTTVMFAFIQLTHPSAPLRDSTEPNFIESVRIQLNRRRMCEYKLKINLSLLNNNRTLFSTTSPSLKFTFTPTSRLCTPLMTPITLNLVSSQSNRYTSIISLVERQTNPDDGNKICITSLEHLAPKKPRFLNK